jgi:hypothetical protein
MIKRIFDDSIERMTYKTFALFPELIPFAVTAGCKRYQKNVASVRASLQKIINGQRTGTCSGSFEDCADLLEILLSSPIYQNIDE